MKRRSNVTGVGGSNKNSRVQCSKCQKSMRSDHLNRHLKSHNSSKRCKYCNKLLREDQLAKHEILCKDGIDEAKCNRGECAMLETDLEYSSVSGTFRTFRLNVESDPDYDKLLAKVILAAKAIIMHLVKQCPIKAQVWLELNFFEKTSFGKDRTIRIFRSIMEPILEGTKVESFLERSKVYLKSQIEWWQGRGSALQFDGLGKAFVDASRYKPLCGGCQFEAPKIVKDMKSVLNIKAPDDKCFLYCLLAKMYPVKQNPYRPSKYSAKEAKIQMGDVAFPVKIADISKIEELNNISISVFEWSKDDNYVIPLHHGSINGTGTGTQINLLYIRENFIGHYLLIKDFNAFMRHRTKHHNSMHFCLRCLHGFTREQHLTEHSPLCDQGVNQITKMPHAGEVIEFKALHKKDKKLFVIYFDFECLTVPVDVESKSQATRKYQHHVPCSFCIVTKSEFDDYGEEEIVFSNGDPDEVIYQFLMHLFRIYQSMMDCYEKHQCSIDMTDKDEQNFLNAKYCHICGKKLDWKSKNNYPVRDHDHSKKQNNFRGAAHLSCNINYFNRTKKVPVICHNLKSYDMNLFILDLIKSSGKLDIIAENLEKFKAVFTEDFIFLDSFAFLSSSLDKLSDDLKLSDINSFKRLQRAFPTKYSDLMNKCVYFYDYASSYNVLEEKLLPPKDAFYNKLKDEEISDDAYKRAQRTYSRFDCHSLKDYMELYVKADAILLCDIFEHFRDLCLNFYELDPCHYLSLPGFTWDAMLKMTGVQLELITDVDKYNFVEKNLRGGVCTINHRHFTANNTYLDNFDSKQKTSFIHYIDANNLYGASMSRPLPTGNFRWLTRPQIESLRLMDLDPDGNICYILEVDLKYPEHLHDLHNDYPLAVEKKAIRKDQLSQFNMDCLEAVSEKFTPTEKLCPDLTGKTKYVMSLRNFQLCVTHGLIPERIHRVLIADQRAFLQPYIEFNSKKRQESKSKFSSDFFKLCNNAIYGKFIEDIRKRSNVSAVKTARKAEKLIARPQYMGFRVLDETVTLVQSAKKLVKLNKPIACGFIVLENAKCIMGSFWYDILKPRYGSDIKLLLSDTDSFIYAVFTEDGYRDLYDIRQHMDLAGYQDGTSLSRFKDVTNKKVPGKFSDEKPTEVIKEVIALKPKMYSVSTKALTCANSKDVNHSCSTVCRDRHSITAKGVSKSAQKSISHEDYRRVLKEKVTTCCVNRTIRSYNRTLYSIEIKKRGLFAFDDKKFIMNDGINTLSYGHYKLSDV
ncbi:hypothetical protein ACHWQZ_G009911 [Mnemiopsis leidyi]